MSHLTSARQFLAEFLRHRALKPSSELNVTYALNAFEAWQKREATLDDLRNGLSDFIRARLIAKKSPYGVKTQRGALLTLLNAAVTAKLIDSYNTPRGVRCPQLAPRALRHWELVKLLEGCTTLPHGALMQGAMLLVYDTGFRRADTLSALWSDIIDETVRVVVEKTGRVESRRLRPETLELLSKLRNATDDRLIPWPRTLKAWHYWWGQLCTRTGIKIPRSGLQMIRRSGASYVHAAGGNASHFLGHGLRCSHLAGQFYLDPVICDQPPPLPPPLPKAG